MSKSAEAAMTVKSDKSADGASGGASGKGPGFSIGETDGKGTGIEFGAGEKSAGVSVGIEAGKSGGMSIGIGLGDSARGAQASSPGFGDVDAGAEKTGDGLSVGGVSVIPESVVAPLIGAGANVYIMTNELTQSMRQKLGTSWPFLQDTLSSRYAKLVAGGLLASVSAVILWKIFKRLTRSKKPVDSEDEDEDSDQWTIAPMYELTPVPERKPQAFTSEGDSAFNLPHKIQLRISDSPVQATKNGEREICKAREPATRHRHTRHLEPHGQDRIGEGGPSVCSPWHSEHRRSTANCNCTNPQHCGCSLLPPQPRLLYSVRENHMLHRALDHNMENILTCTSCPANVCSPTLQTPVACAHSMGPKPCCLSTHVYAPCGTLHHHPLIHSSEVMTTNSHRQLACPGMQPGIQHGTVHGIGYMSTYQGEPMKAAVPWPMYSVQETHPSESGFDRKVRSVNQQTDSQPTDVDPDTAGHGLDVPCSMGYQTGRHCQSIPTRTAQSPVTASQCTNTPMRADNRSSVTCPTRLSTQPYMATIGHTPQVVQLSLEGGEYPGSFYPHQPATEGFSSRALALPPVSYRPHLPSILPPVAQQQRAQPQQQQQPVVQLPSDSSCSQNSTEACTSHENRQYEGAQTTSVNQEAQAEAPSQERSLLPQQSTAMGNHHHASGLRVLGDHSHADYPWHRPQAFHSYQPSPLCPVGYQSPSYKPYTPPSNVSMFLTPSGSLIMSSNAGMFHTSAPALLSSSQPMTSFWHAPYLYPQGHMPRHTPFNTNFNLSNSNASVFMQETGPNSTQAMPVHQESSRLRVINSNHSISSSQANATAANKVESTSFSSSDISLQMVEADAAATTAEVMMTNPNTASASEERDAKTTKSSDPSQIELASSRKEFSAEKDASPSLDAEMPEYFDQEPETAAAASGVDAAASGVDADVDGEPQADICSIGHTEEGATCFTPAPCCTFVASALSDDGETQL